VAASVGRIQGIQGRPGRWSPLRRWTPWSQSSPSEVLKIYDALWTFGRVEGVEPTNNTAERAIRPGVLWRTDSLGTQSAQGSRFVVDQIRRPSRTSYFVVINLLTALAMESGFNSAWVAVHVPRASLP